MILDFIRDNLDGNFWEKWCDACYRDRFQDQNFIKVPAEHLGTQESRDLHCQE